MKRGTDAHPKFENFRTAAGLDRYQAAGVLEMLWHFTAKYTPNGEIGKYPASSIFRDWTGPGTAESLVNHLIDTQWLDRLDDGRLVVHDWHEHCDDAVHMQLARMVQLFANGQMPKLSRFGRNERAELEARFSVHIKTHGKHIKTHGTRTACTEKRTALPRLAPPCPAPPSPALPVCPADGQTDGGGPSAGVDQRDRDWSDVCEAAQVALGRKLTASEDRPIREWFNALPESVTVHDKPERGVVLALKCLDAASGKSQTIRGLLSYVSPIVSRCIREACWPGEFAPSENQYVKPGSPAAHKIASAKASAAVAEQEAARAKQRAQEQAEQAALAARLDRLDDLDHDTLAALKAKAVSAAPNDFTRKNFAAADPRTNRPLRIAMLAHIEEPANA